MKKKAWYLLGAAALVIAAALFFLLPSSGSGTYDNLIKNGDFEKLSSQGLPESWYTDAYVYQGYTTFSSAQGQQGRGAHIQNHMPNDARFAQSVSVSPATLYRLHGYVKADAEGGLGANLSIEGIYVFSQSVYDTKDGWQEVTLYGRTGENQRSVTVYARLGGYSGEATGEACFDDITLCRVDSVPAGAYALSWYQQEPAQPESSNTAPAPGMLPLIVFAVLFYHLFLFAFVFLLLDYLSDYLIF